MAGVDATVASDECTSEPLLAREPRVSAVQTERADDRVESLGRFEDGVLGGGVPVAQEVLPQTSGRHHVQEGVSTPRWVDARAVEFLGVVHGRPRCALAQKYEPLAASVQAALHAAVADRASPEPKFSSMQEKIEWLAEMSRRLEKRLPDRQARIEFLKTVHYEAQRAGLEPQLVLGLIQVESGFKKYAVSSAGARGYMQVMPFWLKLLGADDHNLFHLRTNLRFGCTILRHYLDIEKGDLYRALGRYNGSLGAPEYPNLVRGAWERQWSWGQRIMTVPR